MKLLLCFISASLLICFAGCKGAGSNISYVTGSKIFATKYNEGFYGTHSKGHYILMVRQDRKWQPIWKGISGWPLIAWDDVVLFTAVTSDSGHPRYLMYLNGLGAIRIDEEIQSYRMRSLGDLKSKDMLEGRVQWQVGENEIVWIAPKDSPSSESVEVRIPLSTLVTMAKEGFAKKTKKSFHGNEFFE